MFIPYLIAYSNTFVWLIPPFRQYRTKYFYFFLVLALMDPVVLIFWRLLLINPQLISPVVALFLIFSLFPISSKNILLTFFSCLVLILGEPYLNNTQILLLNALIHIVVLVIIINHFLKFTAEKNSISLFYIFVISYELSTILKNSEYLTFEL